MHRASASKNLQINKTIVFFCHFPSVYFFFQFIFIYTVFIIIIIIDRAYRREKKKKKTLTGKELKKVGKKRHKLNRIAIKKVLKVYN